jgi:hypothetical protein
LIKKISNAPSKPTEKIILIKAILNVLPALVKKAVLASALTVLSHVMKDTKWNTKIIFKIKKKNIVFYCDCGKMNHQTDACTKFTTENDYVP